MPARRLKALLSSDSLSARMVLAAAVWSVISLVVAGIVLTALYRSSVERSFDARLNVYQKALAGSLAASPDADAPDDGRMGEPGFLLPLSGWYWLIRDPDSGETLSMSRSLFGDVLDLEPPPADGESRAGYLEGPGGIELRVVSQVVHLDGDRNYDVVVAGNADELRSDVASFSRSVFVTLAVFAAGLVIGTIFQVRVGLRPLAAVSAALAEIRNGAADRLVGQFPREIEGLAAELNALIEANRKVVERALANTGNLAHALKTPLSVILNETRADNGPLAAKVREQAGLMRSRIESDLDRARIAAERRVVGAASELAPSAEGLARVLRRAYPEPPVRIDIACPPDMRVRVEKRDLEEMLGNVMDNACKFGRGHVVVSARAGAADASGRSMVAIRVEDNGPGLEPQQRGIVLQRGRRLDESIPGSGLGLSIVDELVEVYGGRLILDKSAKGGLAVELILPRS
ncbi:sensor histidine kinase [Methylobrevis pamukkalensis]|uniref:histidine kinase n=1 Tax=Methylobrevis pamukkalensis TaxID=1439726 RepID=A0A1E3H7X4_9HYPH|nr:sensor histidine kinase [Methylobrevis pamukkalensis]ODN72449.1 Sensor protein PhoQ [Methylobrevis pamukkalensis]